MHTEKFLKTDDKVTIAVNHFDGQTEAVVIICPGWFMTKDSKSFYSMSKEFSKHYDVIAMDFRGHGKSSGFYTFTSNEPMDLKCVVEFAKSKYRKIYLLGFSLGAAVTLIHAANVNDIDKVIAVSAPSDFCRIENQMWRQEAWKPTIFKKFEPKRWISVRPGLITKKKVKPIDIVKEIDCPILFIAGEKDPTVFPWHTKKLYDLAGGVKRFELFENCSHAEDLFLEAKEKFMSLCFDFLDN